jgi:hypothetical protein
MDVWQEPLELCARVGAKLSSGELVYSHEQLSDALNDSDAAVTSQPATAGPLAGRAPQVGPTARSSRGSMHRLKRNSARQHRPSLVDAWQHGSTATSDHAGRQADHVTPQDHISAAAELTARPEAEDLLEDDGDEEAQFKAILELDLLLSALEYSPHQRSTLPLQDVASAGTRQGHSASCRATQHRKNTRGSRSVFSEALKGLSSTAFSQSEGSGSDFSPSFIRKRGMPLETQPPTVLEFEGAGSHTVEQAEEHASKQLAASPTCKPADSSSAMLGTCSKEVPSAGPPRPPCTQPEQPAAQPFQSQPFMQRGNDLLAACKLCARTAADLMSVWNTAGGLEREMHSSAAHSTCSVTQPQQTDDSCYECDSFWDTEAMSQRDVSAAGYRKSVTIRTAQIDSKDHGLEVSDAVI